MSAEKIGSWDARLAQAVQERPTRPGPTPMLKALIMVLVAVSFVACTANQPKI
jgi:hypothetical protein